MSFAGKGAEADDPSILNLRTGRDGWLYSWHRGLVAREEGRSVYGPAQVEALIGMLDKRAEWLKSRAIRYAFTVAPDKASVYPEYLPEDVAFASPSHISQLRKILGDRDYWVDLLKPLLKAKDTTQVYFKTDSHWNYDAALIAANLILKKIGQKPFSNEEVISSEITRIWDLGRYLDAVEQETSVKYDPGSINPVKLVFEPRKLGKFRVSVFETENTTLPTCVIFRDSYSTFYINYLLQRFSRVVAIASRELHYDIVESEEPDVVISQIAERYVDVVRGDDQTRSFGDVFGIDVASIKSQTSR